METHRLLWATNQLGNQTADGTIPSALIAGSSLRLNQNTPSIHLTIPNGVQNQILTVYNTGSVPVFVGEAGNFATIGSNAGIVFQYTGTNWVNLQSTRLYLATGKTGAQALLAAASDITWNAPANSVGIQYVSPGSFTLPSDRTYMLEAIFTPTIANIAFTIQWVDSSNNPVGNPNIPAQGLASLDHVHATSLFRPTTDTTVKLRASGITLPVSIGPVSSVFIRSLDA